jgi:hypothetical protein
MGRVYSEAEKMAQVASLQRNGRHNEAANLSQRYGNERKNPSLKNHFWNEAERSRRIRDSD